MRTREQNLSKDDGGHRFWNMVEKDRSLEADKTAVLLCDVWDGHWCRGAVERLADLLPGIEKVANHMRQKGATIIHSPSDTLDFYRDSPARERALAVPRIPLPKPKNLPDPPLPIDDTDGGGDTDRNNGGVNQRFWSRQHPDITINEDVDFVSDNGEEIYSLLRQQNLTTVLFMGVHTNMCVLHRPFGIKNLVRWGVDTVLCRDLTDAMYNPGSPPYVSHTEGTRLVIEYIEKFWCPTTTSDAVLSL